jgi:hypothetical protein
MRSSPLRLIKIKTPHVFREALWFQNFVALYFCPNTKDSRRDREVVVDMDIPKWAKFIMGAILCEGERLVK